MSRIGKQPIIIPDKVDFKINNNNVSVKGANGHLEMTYSEKVKVTVAGKQVTLAPVDESKEAKALWGTTRTLINNMVVGVTKGFTKILEFNGVGYKASTKGTALELSLGFSHPIVYEVPKGIVAKVNKNQIEISGSDKDLVGFTAAKVRSFRPPEPYKGKGLKYLDEKILRKAGKTGAKK